MKLAFFGSLRIRMVPLVALAIMPCMVLVAWMGFGPDTLPAGEPPVFREGSKFGGVHGKA